METDCFSHRQDRIKQLIRDQEWPKARYLICSILNSDLELEVTDISWLILHWLKLAIQMQDYPEARKAVSLRHKNLVSFSSSEQILWLKLHAEIFFQNGFNVSDNAIDLILIWRELMELLRAAKKWNDCQEWSQRTLECLINNQISNLIWEPLLWWLKWSTQSRTIQVPSIQILIRAFKLEPNKIMLNYILDSSKAIDAESAEAVIQQLHQWVIDSSQKLPQNPSCYKLNQSALEAVKAGNLEELKSLLEKGVPPEGYPTESTIWSVSLTQEINLEIIKVLLAFGARVDSRNQSGFSALMLAVMQGNKALFKTLIMHGADPLQLTSEKSNLLHLAVKSNQQDMFKILLGYGLNPNWPDRLGITARQLAQDLNQSEILKILKA